MGTLKSIPEGHLPNGKDTYSCGMADDQSPLEAIYEARRVRLQELVEQCGGRQVALAEEIATRSALHPDLAESLTSFKDVSYISRALKRIKNIGEEPAYALEVIFGKPRYWMGVQPSPFNSRALQAAWDGLTPAQRSFAEELLLLHIRAIRATEEVPERRERERPQKAV